MSASYVVLSTPHSRWIIALDPFDDLLAEDAVRPDHQGQDHQDVRREVLGPAAYVRVHVAGGHVLHDADDQPADHRARDRVEPAQDHNREYLEAHQRQVDVDAQQVAPDDPAERGDDPGHRPGETEVPLYVDSHRHRDLLTVRDRPHRD